MENQDELLESVRDVRSELASTSATLASIISASFELLLNKVDAIERTLIQRRTENIQTDSTQGNTVAQERRKILSHKGKGLLQDQPLMHLGSTSASATPRSSSESKLPLYKLVILDRVGTLNTSTGQYYVVKKVPIPINVAIMTLAGEEVPDGDDIASAKVELVVLGGGFQFDEWTEDEFRDYEVKDMTVIKNRFQLVRGRNTYGKASFDKASGRKLVKLGAKIYSLGDSRLSSIRVLEGVSNEFKVLEREREPENRKRKKRSQEDSFALSLEGAISGSPMASQLAYVPNGIIDDLRKILSDHLPSAMATLQTGIWAFLNASLIPHLQELQKGLQEFSTMLEQGCPALGAIQDVNATIHEVLPDLSPVIPEAVALKSHLEILHRKLGNFCTLCGGQGQPGTPQSILRSNLPTNSQGHITDPATATTDDFPSAQNQRNTYPSGPSHTYSAPRTGGHDAVHYYPAPGMGGPGGMGGQQYGPMLWRPSYARTPNSRWTPGWSSPTAYLGQTSGSNRNFMDDQYSEGYVVPSEYDNNAYAGSEQTENTYGPYGYGNEGVLVRNNRPADLVRRPRQQKLADSPLYTPISHQQAIVMVGLSHQQAMYRQVLMMSIYEGRRLYGNSPIWWRHLISGHAAVRRISQQQAMDEIVQMMSRLDITKSRLTIGMKRKTEIKVVVDEPEPSSSVLVKNNKQQELISQSASFGDDKNNNKSSQFVVVDFRATCWDKDENKYGLHRQEIIEFSSVLVDAATGFPKTVFHTYVSPKENPVLSEFCKKWTGIRQADVEPPNAVELPEALQMHQAWIQENNKPGYVNNDVVVVAWGDWDFRTMLKQECFRKKLSIPDYFAQWINLKIPFAAKYGDGYWKRTVRDALQHAMVQVQAEEISKKGTQGFWPDLWDGYWDGAVKAGDYRFQARTDQAENKTRLLSLFIHQGANLAITSRLDRR